MQNGKKFKKVDENLQTLLEAIHEGIWDWNIESNGVKFSDSWCRSLGYDPDEVTHHFSFYEGLIHPEDWQEVKKQLHDHLEGHTPIFESENRILMKSGNWRWNLDRGKVVPGMPMANRLVCWWWALIFPNEKGKRNEKTSNERFWKRR